MPKEEAEQVVNRLRQAGKQVEAHYYPNEGHGFAKRENQIDSVRRTVEWFELRRRESPFAWTMPRTGTGQSRLMSGSPPDPCQRRLNR